LQSSLPLSSQKLADLASPADGIINIGSTKFKSAFIPFRHPLDGKKVSNEKPGEAI
jgi:hypothetical protein